MSGNSAFSKIDWLFLSIWSIAFLFMIIILSYITFIFFQEILHKLNLKITSFIFESILLFLILMLLFLRGGQFNEKQKTKNLP